MLEKIDCYECGEELQENDTMYYVGNGEYICNDCRWDYYTTCDDCNELVYYDDAQPVYRRGDELLICPDCLQYYTYCDHCEQYVPDNEVWYSDDDISICNGCSYNYHICYDCGSAVHVDDVPDINDGYYCRDCADYHRREYILSYSSKPGPVFYGGDAGYGIEVEIDDGNDKWDAAGDIIEAGGDHIYIKEDGSLSYKGMEIVTHPATLEYHINKFPWTDICNAALDYDYRSHDTDTCGLHIHASRSLFGATQMEQDLTIAKIMLLVDRYYDTYIVRFARRDINKMRRWADKPGADIQPGDDEYDAIQKSKDSSRGDRYKAVNLCNYSTVEFRFFRGTLKRDTIIASIQWVDTIINYCKATPLKNLFNANWHDIFGNTGHKELTNYLKQRNLYNLKKDVM